jgi:hypothetical protein
MGIETLEICCFHQKKCFFYQDAGSTYVQNVDTYLTSPAPIPEDYNLNITGTSKLEFMKEFISPNITLWLIKLDNVNKTKDRTTATWMRYFRKYKG